MCDCRIAAQLVTVFVCSTVSGDVPGRARERGFSPDCYSKSYHGNRGDTTV